MLSKSDLLSLLQCPRKLWFDKRLVDEVLDKDSSQERRAMDGHLVSEKARHVLGDAVLWPRGKDTPEESMAAALASIAKNPGVPVVEMPMIREGLYARADALQPLEDGTFRLEETKSSTFPLKKDKVTPDKPKEHYVNDVVIQAWVAEATGLPIAEHALNLLDSRWIYQGDDDYSELFRLQNLDEHVAELKALVPIWLKQAQDVVAGEMPKDITVGRQCKDPYACPYKDRCTAMEPDLPEHPLTLLPDAAGKLLANKLADEGFTSLTDVPEQRLYESNRFELYNRIRLAHISGKPILEPAVRQIIKDLPYPRYYFDFEGIDLPVPRWNGVRPYEQIPFQWSCHVEREPGRFEHYAFLDVSGQDPSRACIERMREVIDEKDNGPILVYYQTYEKGRLRELGERHPEFMELMESYIGRLFDLHPVVKNFYYHPDMKGSFSIKKVLPTIAPDLDYSELEDVQEGTGAQIAYLHLAFSGLSRQKREDLVRNELAYCEQDTWAMVVVSYFLEGRERVDIPAPDMTPMLQLQQQSAKQRGLDVRQAHQVVEFEDVDF